MVKASVVMIKQLSSEPLFLIHRCLVHLCLIHRCLIHSVSDSSISDSPYRIQPIESGSTNTEESAQVILEVSFSPQEEMKEVIKTRQIG
jgi:hypothetical protein